MHELIEHLKQKQWLWQGVNTSRQTMPLSLASTGFEEFDRRLDGGFPEQGVIDLHSLSGIGELRLLFPHLRHADDGRLIVFIQPPADLNAETLIAEQMDTERTLLIEPQTTRHAFWAAEQCLKSGACSHVLLWCDEVEIHQARRFQVGCETGHCRQFLFRPAQQRLFSLPVSLSLRLTPHDSGIDVQITKRKGHWDPKPFTIAMDRFWPQLVLHTPSPVIIPFPVRKQG